MDPFTKCLKNISHYTNVKPINWLDYEKPKIVLTKFTDPKYILLGIALWGVL